MVELSTNDLTALCPITGQPDFYEPTLSYHPGASLIESKSLKLDLWGFRDRGIFAEDLAATLLEDLVSAACNPAEMTVDLTQQARGDSRSGPSTVTPQNKAVSLESEPRVSEGYGPLASRLCRSRYRRPDASSWLKVVNKT